MKCALYARVSLRDRQECENQLAQLRAFAATQGWRIIAEYTDQESGRKALRPQFIKLFDDASRHKFDVVLFWSVDRFSREGALETLQYLRTLTSYAVNFRSFTEAYIDSCGVFRDAIIAILAVVAKQEAIRISDRTKAGLARARKRGVTLGRPRKALNVAAFARMSAAGASLAKLADKFHISESTAARLKKTATKAA